MRGADSRKVCEHALTWIISVDRPLSITSDTGHRRVGADEREVAAAVHARPLRMSVDRADIRE
jgi:hypothetical protein